MERLIEILAVGGTIAGLFLLSENNANGFTIGLLSNLLWIWHGNNMPKGGQGIMLVNAILFVINLNGLGVI